MSLAMIGEISALASAFVWALALVLFKLSGERVPPMALNLFKNTIALVLLAVTLAFIPGGYAYLAGADRGELAIMLLSGVLGIAIADTLVFWALNLCGVGILSIVDCTYTPFIMLFAWLIVGEEITAMRLIGAGLIVLAVLLASRHPPPPDRTRRQIVAGVLLGVAAMATMAAGINYAKLAMDFNRFPLIEATLVRMIGGWAALALLAAASPQRGRYLALFRPSPIWKASASASVLGGYLSMVLWMAGFKYADASVAAVINQTTVFFSMALATLLLGEPFGWRRGLSMGLAFAGVLIATEVIALPVP